MEKMIEGVIEMAVGLRSALSYRILAIGEPTTRFVAIRTVQCSPRLIYEARKWSVLRFARARICAIGGSS